MHWWITTIVIPIIVATIIFLIQKAINDKSWWSKLKSRFESCKNITTTVYRRDNPWVKGYERHFTPGRFRTAWFIFTGRKDKLSNFQSIDRYNNVVTLSYGTLPEKVDAAWFTRYTDCKK